MVGCLPCMCLLPFYLTSPHVIKSPRPSPSVFAYCKQSKTGGGNGLGMRLGELCVCEEGGVGSGNGGV